MLFFCKCQWSLAPGPESLYKSYVHSWCTKWSQRHKMTTYRWKHLQRHSYIRRYNEVGASRDIKPLRTMGPRTVLSGGSAGEGVWARCVIIRPQSNLWFEIKDAALWTTRCVKPFSTRVCLFLRLLLDTLVFYLYFLPPFLVDSLVLPVLDLMHIVKTNKCSWIL